MLTGTPAILRKYVPWRQLEELEATRSLQILREISWWLKNRIFAAPAFWGSGIPDPALPTCLHYFTEQCDIRLTAVNHAKLLGFGYIQSSLEFRVFRIRRMTELDYMFIELGENGAYMREVMKTEMRA